MTRETSKQKKTGLTIQEMAQQSGMSEHTLRYYERVGLLTPIPRDCSSGHRRYPPESVGVIETLTCLRGTGMSIESMREYLRLREHGAAAASEQKALFAAHESALIREMELMQKRLAYLSGKVAFWEAVEMGDLDKAHEIADANQQMVRALTLTEKRETL